MGIFNRYKPLNEYKVLEVVNEKRTPIDINDASGTKHKVLFEDDNVQIFLYITESFNIQHHYLLRREKNNKGKVVYLGTTLDMVCYCNGKVFYVSAYALRMNNHRMTMIDCNSGERQEVDFLGRDEVLGINVKQSSDKIMAISSADQWITILVRRNKIVKSGFEETSYNEDFMYEIKVDYQNGLFNLMPVSEESIVTRGPWPKPKVKLPLEQLTPALLSSYYDRYGKEDVDEALMIRALYE